MSKSAQSGDGKIACSVAAAFSSWQGECSLLLPSGATVEEALHAASELLQARGILWNAQEIEWWRNGAVGIFGEACSRVRLLQAGDRVEVYRPLAVDPKSARRARARERQTDKGRNPLTVKRP